MNARDGSAERRHRAIRVLPLSGVASLLTGCEPGVLDPAGPVAAQERLILIDSLAIMLAIVIPTILATLGFAWWFRAGNAKAKRSLNWSYSGQLELLVWSVPALVVIFLGGIAWIGSHALDPAIPLASPSTKPLRVEVVSLDWKWLFLYPDQGVASVNRLVLPAGQPVDFRLTSATVMNSFFVPRLGSQIYAMAGMTTALHLQADRPGAYRGLSANYSGKGFPDMAFAADVVPADQFAAWATQARGSGQSLDAKTYAALAAPSANVAPATYRGVAPGLFDAIVRDGGRQAPRPAIDGRAE